MAESLQDKAMAFSRDLQKAQIRRPDGSGGLDGAALHAAVRDHREGCGEFVRSKCEHAAADPELLAFAILLAKIYKREFADNALIQIVVARGQSLEPLFGEPAERKAARDWWNGPKQKARDGTGCSYCSVSRAEKVIFWTVDME